MNQTPSTAPLSSPSPSLLAAFRRFLSWAFTVLPLAIGLLATSAHAGPPFPEFVDPNPSAGNQFGASVVALSTGNVVITAPGDAAGGSSAGAVYLFNGATGALISTLRGTSANDQVGGGGVMALSNGNYVVISPFWKNGAASFAGAVTWGSGTTGVSGVVNASNSLVGTTSSDFLGNGGVTALSNGNYVVSSSSWDNGAATDAGAVTWGNGTTGTNGAVTSINSLVGTSANDQIGSSKVTALNNGNYVVISTFWKNGASGSAGAVTWGSGTTGITGTVTSINSLVGTTAGDRVGSQGVTALSNGNYVVRSPSWDNGAATDAGAVTWGNGTTGISGAVTSTNSLVGTSSNDQVGQNGVTALSNGNYVVSSSFWKNGGFANAGAVTWGNGTTGITGAVTSTNSLVGATSNENVGNGGVTALSNGNYTVSTPNWDNGVVVNVGAVTWASGTTGITGAVTAANSFVGTTASDNVGDSGVTALSNGNYVVKSPSWDNGATTNAGAATWGNGTTGITGTVTSINSLVGTSANDQVGSSGVTALGNGNYVVISSSWNNGATTFAGAATWGSGATGITGAVTSTNSLVGGTAFDQIGSNGVMALSNGNFVVISSSWDNGAAPNVGAVTWGSGTAGITGVVSASNSLIGSTSGFPGPFGSTADNVGAGGVTALSNGNYVVSTPKWDNGAVTDVGAVTWGSGTTGISGAVSAANSLVGLTANAGLPTDLKPVVTDNVNLTFFGRFINEGTGKVRLGSQVDGLAAAINTAPLVSAPTSAAITGTAATLGGNVTADGGSVITERGVVYSLTSANADPLISGIGVTKVTAAGTTGVFTAPVTGLTAGSGYSFKAYAINGIGTTYTSPVATFTTLSNNADLSNLVVTTATPNQAFAPSVLSYTAAVPLATASITVTPSAAQGAATITVNGNPVSSGAASGSISLNVGPNTITIVVTAQDTTTTKTYTVAITRGAPPPTGFASIVTKVATAPPGVTNGATYGSFYDASINNADRIIFSASLLGGTGGIVQDQGTWTQGTNGTLALVLRAGTDIDGVQSVGRTFSFPRLADNGVGTVQTDAAGAGSIIHTQWIDDGVANVSLFAKRTTVFASVPANSAFTGFGYTSQNQATGEGYFASNLVQGGAGAGQVTGTNDSGVWKVAADGSVTAAAREGDALPATVGIGLSQSEVTRIATGPGNLGVYRGLLSGTGVTSNNSVLVLRRDFTAMADPEPVLRTDDQAADCPAGCKYYDTHGETINTSGKSVVWATLFGTGVTVSNNRALFSDRTGTMAKVIRYGDDLSAAFGGTVSLSQITSYWLLDDNNIVVRGLLTGTGVTGSNDQFVALISTTGTITKLIREGDTAAAIGSSTIDILNGVDVSTGGKIAILASTLNGTGDSAGNLNNQGLLTSDITTPGTYTLTLRKGSIIPGGVKQIWSITMSQQTVQGSTGSPAGMSRVVNNNGKVVVMVVFYDNDQGVFVGP